MTHRMALRAGAPCGVSVQFVKVSGEFTDEFRLLFAK